MKKLLIVFLLSLLAILVGVGLLALIKSPGKAQRIKGNHDNSISVIEKLSVGGVEQHLIIRGVDSTKPILLFIHGGPGFSGYHFLNDSQHNLEEEFVLAYWEQRGAGKSYSDDMPVESLALERFVEDAKELTDYLKKRFHKDKIYILGHSWGSLVGTLTIEKYPEDYHAYIGIGQIANQYESEKLSLQWLKDQAKSRNDQNTLTELNQLNFPNASATGKEWFNYMNQQRLLVGKYGGSVSAGKELKFLSIYYDIIFRLPEYTVREKRNIMKGNTMSLCALQDDVIQTNLMTTIDSLEIPVHFFHGKHDHLVEYEVANKFYEKIKAPGKYFYTFEHSAHRPFADETKKFNTIIREIKALDTN